jgi:hypothetical protein
MCVQFSRPVMDYTLKVQLQEDYRTPAPGPLFMSINHGLIRGRKHNVDQRLVSADVHNRVTGFSVCRAGLYNAARGNEIIFTVTMVTKHVLKVTKTTCL